MKLVFIQGVEQDRMTNLQTIGVIGAGQMGNGIAHVSALAGYDVVMTDISEDALKHGMDAIEKNMARQVAREQYTVDEMKTAMARIKTSTSIKAHENDDLVIEAATEKREVKEQIFRSICEIVPAKTFLATNTSSISVTRLASVTDRPEMFIGMHFIRRQTDLLQPHHCSRPIGKRHRATQMIQMGQASISTSIIYDLKLIPRYQNNVQKLE